MKRHPILPAQMVANEDGRDTVFYGNGNVGARNVVTRETRDQEDKEIRQMRSPAMPPDKRNYLSWRGMVRYNIAVAHRQTPAYLHRNADDWRAVY